MYIIYKILNEEVKEIKMEENNSNTYIVLNEKGGVGKSITSKFILPTLLYIPGIKINVYEIDNNNSSTNFDSELINYKLFKISDQNKAIFDISFNEYDANTISIVDVGGGDDVLAVLASLSKNEISNPNFIIPTNDDAEQFVNITNTVAKIKKYYNNPKITLVLNKVHDISNPRAQFVNLFGNEKWGYKPNFQIIESDIHSMCMIPDSPLFVALKNQYKITLLDMYLHAKDLTDNATEYRKRWKVAAKGNKQYYFDKLDTMNFADDIVAFVNILKKSFSDL